RAGLARQIRTMGQWEDLTAARGRTDRQVHRAHRYTGPGRRAYGRGHGQSWGRRIPHHPPRTNGSDPEVHYRDHRRSDPRAAAPRPGPDGLYARALPRESAGVLTRLLAAASP